MPNIIFDIVFFVFSIPQFTNKHNSSLYNISLIKYLWFDRDYGKQKVNSNPEVSTEFNEVILEFCFALHICFYQQPLTTPFFSSSFQFEEETDLRMVEVTEEWETPS